MNTSKAALMIVLLLCLATLAGCNEGHARNCGPADGRQVVLEPSGTGFWYARVVSPGNR